MREFAVVTDSTSDIPPEVADEHGVLVVPLRVFFGEESFADGELSQEEFFARMNAASELPVTSQPSIGAMEEAFAHALEGAKYVIAVHVSSRLSGTVEAARQAAVRFADRVHVFDSRSLSWGAAFQVLDAASSATQGLSVDAALERLERVRDRVRVIVGLDSLDNLAKGGRIGKVAAYFGSLLDLKVTITIDPSGALVPLHRVRGKRAAIDRTLHWVDERMGDAKRGSFTVMHALSEDVAQQLREALESRFDVTRMFVVPTGITISTHSGTGWGVALLPED